MVCACARLFVTDCGRYHSHPGFPAQPSLIDIENQRAYQQNFCGDRVSATPFVAGICSTLPSEVQPAIFCCVDDGESAGSTAFASLGAGSLEVQIVPDAASSAENMGVDVDTVLQGVEKFFEQDGADMCLDERLWKRIRDSWPGESFADKFIEQVQRIMNIL